MKKIALLILLLLVSIASCAQENSILVVIDSLRTEYSLYPNEYPIRMEEGTNEIPPQPPLLESYNDRQCIEAYNIPTEILTKYYPWNADSIVISLYEAFPSDTDLGNRLGILDATQREELTHILYNQDVKTHPTGIYIGVISILGSGLPIPNFRLIFYHNNESFFADFYKHIDNEMVILDSSYTNPYEEYQNAYSIYDNYSYVYWGGECSDTFYEIHALIQRHFEVKVGDGKYEADYDNEVWELPKEREPESN